MTPNSHRALFFVLAFLNSVVVMVVNGWATTPLRPVVTTTGTTWQWQRQKAFVVTTKTTKTRTTTTTTMTRFHHHDEHQNHRKRVCLWEKPTNDDEDDDDDDDEESSSSESDTELGGGDSGFSLEPNERRVCEFVSDLNASELSFRIIVVGKGAILETTSIMGPVMKLGTSPVTGQTILTIASDDKSFEFHVKTEEVSKITVTEKHGSNPDSIQAPLRLFRFVNLDGESMCTLILKDASSVGVEWFLQMKEKYGEELQVVLEEEKEAVVP